MIRAARSGTGRRDSVSTGEAGRQLQRGSIDAHVHPHEGHTGLASSAPTAQHSTGDSARATSPTSADTWRLSERALRRTNSSARPGPVLEVDHYSIALLRARELGPRVLRQRQALAPRGPVPPRDSARHAASQSSTPSVSNRSQTPRWSSRLAAPSSPPTTCCSAARCIATLLLLCAVAACPAMRSGAASARCARRATARWCSRSCCCPRRWSRGWLSLRRARLPLWASRPSPCASADLDRPRNSGPRQPISAALRCAAAEFEIASINSIKVQSSSKS